MAGVDHNILWYLNGKYQPDFEGYTTFTIHSGKKRKTGTVTYNLKEREEYVPYVANRVALLNGDSIFVSRDCRFDKLIDYTGDTFYPSKDKCELPKHLIKEEHPKFIKTFVDEGSLYYEPKITCNFLDRILATICPVCKTPHYKAQYLLHSTDTTFLFALYLEDDCNAIFVIDKVYGYSLVGMGGYGWYNNPYLHFINRGYGEAFEKLAAHECYESYLMETLFYSYMHDYLSFHSNDVRDLLAFPNKDYGFLQQEILKEPTAHWTRSLIMDALTLKFGYISNYSEVWNHFNFVRPSATDPDQAIIHHSCFADYNTGNHNPGLTEGVINECSEFIIEGEEYQEGLRRLRSVKLPPSSKFTYTLSQYHDKYMDLVDRQREKQRHDEEEKEATQNENK